MDLSVATKQQGRVGKLGTAVGRAMLLEGYIVLTGGAQGETLTFTPALTIDEDLLGPFARALRKVLDAA